ncbi:MAG: HypC/HybG/HupF family hydrogenase formation chaperone [Lachnospiraceae bacterium]|nr:HypC/HybG/HupF family hydrogenase formation chaperone [Lachnospiraceae bacterium]
MCVALPGRVVAMEDNMATVDFEGNTVRAHAGVVDVKEDDYVLVHAGMIIQKMNRKEAMDMVELFKELEEIADA